MRGTIAAALLFVALVAGCGGGDVSEAEYQAEVVDVRQRLGTSLQGVVEAQTFDQVVNRLEVTARTAEQGAEDLREQGSPPHLDDESRQLVFALEAFGAEVNNTADSLRMDIGQNLGERLQGLHFETWNDVQRALNELRDEGIAVEPLQPLAAEAQG